MVKKPLVIACRGDVANAPEKTLPAFESAIARGADGVALDVHLSADGELVIHHFDRVGTTDDREGLIGEHRPLGQPTLRRRCQTRRSRRISR